nr:tetraacyldisaccharide 4'-kinase [Marinicella sp. W31]MDC2875726.1 tetraacyldisaccharide 4'-kinase [Marinicella sp. W31]
MFDTLTSLGADVADRQALADHAPITARLAGSLLERARQNGLVLVTTAKDMARLAGARDAHLDELRTESTVLEITAVFEDAMMAERFVCATVDAFEARTYGRR